jgi:hypothetical protein
VGGTGKVERDLVVAAALARMEGEVGRDVRLSVADATIAGEVGRDVRGEVTRLSASARSTVRGNVDLQVVEPDEVTVEDGARIGGVMRIDEHPADSRYRHAGWYALQVVQLLGAFLVALILVRVAPSLFTVPFQRTRSVALDIGIGLLVLVATPIVALLAVFTIVGLPLGLIALGAYLLAVYVAGIVVGGRIGNAVLRRRPSNGALPLFVGLLILAVATALPFVGPVLGLVAIVVGLAVMVRVVRDRRTR